MAASRGRRCGGGNRALEEGRNRSAGLAEDMVSGVGEQTSHLSGVCFSSHFLILRNSSSTLPDSLYIFCTKWQKHDVLQEYKNSNFTMFGIRNMQVNVSIIFIVLVIFFKIFINSTGRIMLIHFKLIFSYFHVNIKVSCKK